MSVATYDLETLGQAVEIATVLTGSWFRGQSRQWPSLLPKVSRPGFLDPLSAAICPNRELRIIEEFKRRAPMVAGFPLPTHDDRLGWLIVMQHYGAATRLLDWTENALVALFFTVSVNPEEDGELWAMFPDALNEKAGIGRGMPLIGSSREVEFLTRAPYSTALPEFQAKVCGLDEPVECPVALLPPLRFPRMTAQESAFTIHCAPDLGLTIEQALPDPSHLVRYRVPSNRKVELQEGLRYLGFSDGHLYPDLEGLSRMIALDSKKIAYAPPDPPAAAGEVRGDTNGR